MEINSEEIKNSRKYLFKAITDFVTEKRSEEEIIDFIIKNRNGKESDNMFSNIIKELDVFKKVKYIVSGKGRILDDKGVGIIIELSKADPSILSVIKSYYEMFEDIRKERVKSLILLVSLVRQGSETSDLKYDFEKSLKQKDNEIYILKKEIVETKMNAFNLFVKMNKDCK